MFEDQSNEPDFPAQTGDQWRTAAAHIDKTHHTATKISANRREALDCYSGSPVWLLIEAKLSTAPIASTSLKASAEPSRHRRHFGIRCLRS